MTREADLRRLLRARDAMDRRWAEPLDVRALAGVAMVSPSHFVRTFRSAFGETPHRYLQRRRIERAMAMLRDGVPVTQACMDVGFSSLGTFSRTFREVVGEPPSQYRQRGRGAPPVAGAPTCFVKAWTRPSPHIQERTGGRDEASSFGEASSRPASLASGA